MLILTIRIFAFLLSVGAGFWHILMKDVSDTQAM